MTAREDHAALEARVHAETSKSPLSSFPLLKTPEAIREGIDMRAEPPKVDASGLRQIKVTVSGGRRSGKTTLIAVIAQALRESGHKVNTPKYVPTGAEAIAALHEQFDVTFVEDYLEEAEKTIAALEQGREIITQTAAELVAAEDSVGPEVEPASIHSAVQKRLTAQHETIAKMRETIVSLDDTIAELQGEIAFLKTPAPTEDSGKVPHVFEQRIAAQRQTIAELRVQNAHLENQVKELKQRQLMEPATLISSAEAEKVIAHAFEHIRAASVLDAERSTLKASQDEFRRRINKLTSEVEGRRMAATEMLFHKLTGRAVNPAPSLPESDDRLLAAAPTMSADERLQAANRASMEQD